MVQMKQPCPVCGGACESTSVNTVADPLNYWWAIDCPRCSFFLISSDGEDQILGLTQDQRAFLCAYLRNHSSKRQPVKVHRNVQTLIVGVKYAGEVEAAEQFLLYLDKQTGGTSDPVPVSQENDYPLFYLRGPQGMNSFMGPLQQSEGLIDYKQPSGWHLTFKGLRHVAEIKKARASAQPPVALASSRDDLWVPGTVRVFLSHLSTDRVVVGELKDSLQGLGASAFVAHADITPSRPWLQTILDAVATADCLVALMVPGFKESQWTDHEVGMALGRGIPVLPIMLGEELYGFISSRQGIRGSLERTGDLALLIMSSLLKNPETEGKATDGLIQTLERSGSFIASLDGAKLLPEVRRLTGEQVTRLRGTLKNNQVSGATGVGAAIERTIQRVQADSR